MRALRDAESGRPGSNRRRSAWKADALPTELLPRCVLGNLVDEKLNRIDEKWRVLDSNQRRHSRQIYSLLPLATRATLRKLSIKPQTRLVDLRASEGT